MLATHKAATLLLGALVLGAPGALAGQQDDARWLRDCEQDYGDNVRYCVVRHTGFKPTGNDLTIDPDENGGARVVGWDKDSIAVTARIQADARTEDDAKAIGDKVQIQAAGSSISADGPSSGRHQHWSVEFVVYVPKKTNLTAEVTNGPLSAEGLSGTAELRAQNGPVSIDDMSGDVRVRVQNGPLDITLAGTHWEGKGLDAEAVNGPVDFAVPENYNAEVETGTVNGPSNFDLPITVTLHGGKMDRLRFTMGKGGSPVRVVTTNGPFTIRRARA
jgi:DUF4097 and DUF4098 domain-containing protein YvlB